MGKALAFRRKDSSVDGIVCGGFRFEMRASGLRVTSWQLQMPGAIVTVCVQQETGEGE